MSSITVEVQVDASGYLDLRNAAMLAGTTPGAIRGSIKKGHLGTTTRKPDYKVEGSREIAMIRLVDLQSFLENPPARGRAPGDARTKGMPSKWKTIRRVRNWLAKADNISEQDKAVADATLGVMQENFVTEASEEVEEAAE